MKKKILILSSIIAVTSPVVFAISCGSDKGKDENGSVAGMNGSSIGRGHIGSLNTHHFNVETDFKNKFANISSSKTGTELEVLSKAKLVDLTADELGFVQPTIPDGYNVSYFITSEYDSTSGESLNVGVTIIKAGFTPNSTISFTLSPITPLEKAKQIVESIDYTSSKYPYEIKAITATKQTGLTLADLGLTINEHLPTGFDVTFDIPASYTGVEDIPQITANITKAATLIASINKPLKLKVLDTQAIIDDFATGTFTSTRNWTDTQTWIKGLVTGAKGKSPTTKIALNLDVPSASAWDAALSAASQTGITLENLVVDTALGSASARQEFIDVEGTLNANDKFKMTDDHIAFKLKLS